MIGKKGVLLVNLGTPDAPTRSSVATYLKEFLLDKRVIDAPALIRNFLVRGIIVPFRAGKSAALYKQLWTEQGSPLKFYGERLKDGVQTALGENYIVELGMRYQKPAIEYAINRLLRQQISELIVLPLFPQYASATTGSIHEEVMRVLMEKQLILPLRFISSYCDYDKMIAVFVENARKYDVNSFEHILFSYHGLPKRQIRKGDDCGHCFKENCCEKIEAKNQFCYSAQCHATTRALAAKLQLPKEKYTTCFQSRLGNDPWLEPYTSEVIAQLSKKGVKRVLVFCPAFVADCLETSIEIAVEYREEFVHLGGEELALVESLNGHDNWIQAVADLICSK